MMEREAGRPFSAHPYSDLPSGGGPDPRPPRCARLAGAPLCAEAQADGVPCFELGRDCETCERAYTSWADSRGDGG